MKKYLLSFLAAMLIFVVNSADASHLVSGEITYQHIGSGNYLIRLTIIRDCQGISLPQNPLLTISSSCFNGTLTTQLVNSGFSSNYCSSMQNTCNGGSFPGFQFGVYEGVITLAPCADYAIRFTECCRNFAPINVTSSGQSNFLLETTLDNSSSENSSPVFSQQPMLVVPHNAPVCINNTAFDMDGDSLVYTLVSPLIGNGMSVNFAMGYSAAQPFGTSVASSFNSTTGNICKPANSGVIGSFLMAVKVEEYRNNQLVGSTIRDIQMAVLNTPASSVSINGLVTDAQSNPSANTTIELYEYAIAQGVMPLVSSTTTNSSGEYYFGSVDRKQYMVKAISSDTSYLNTYHNSTFYWNTAQVVYSFCDTLIQANVQMTPVTNPLGTGLVDGYLNGLNIRSLDVELPIYVHLISMSNGLMMSAAAVDSNGYFQFQNVADGDYYMIADITGLNMNSTHFITVNGGGSYGLYNLSATEDGIYAEALVVTSTRDILQAKNEFHIYPNPTSDYLNIRTNQTESYSLELMNIKGELLDNRKGNTEKLSLSVDHLAAGTYFIRITQSGNSSTYRWIKN